MKRAAMWLLSGPFMLTKIAGETSAVASGLPFLLLFMNVATIVLLTTGDDGWRYFFQGVKGLRWVLGIPLIVAFGWLSNRGVSWMKAQVGNDREEVLRWSRIGVLTLFIYGLATFCGFVAALAVVTSRSPGA